MKFGSFSLGECEGAILAHSVSADDIHFRKGLTLTREHLDRLQSSGTESLIVAILEDGDIDEDTAAATVAEAVAGQGVSVKPAFTGRANLHALNDGVLIVDSHEINRLNSVDEAITIATMPNMAVVTKGQMVATAKIIPFAVDGEVLERATGACTRTAFSIASPRIYGLSVAAFQPKKCRLVQTLLPGSKESLRVKSRDVLAGRLQKLGSHISSENECAHRVEALAEELATLEPADIILIMGASAITDRRDVIPAAIEHAGGEILHFGMPADPGNLLLLAKIGRTWVLGLPSCARSPKLNGTDYVLSRLCAGLDVSSADIMTLGVGGLLSEYAGRPQPRAGRAAKGNTKPQIAVAILAAGRSSRMGAENKLLLPYQDTTMLGHVVSEVKKANCHSVFMVVGEQSDSFTAIAAEQQVPMVHNADYASGMASSVRAAISHVPASADGVLIVLADMPGITAEILDKMIASFNRQEGKGIVVPTQGGKQGNPVLWGRDYFEQFDALTGDKGARALLVANQQDVFELEIDHEAIFMDIDTMEAYRAFIEQTEL